jgi:HAE1 family hydrophobic/amphiphilic exporter-1
MLRSLIAGVVIRPVTVTMVTVALLLFGLVAVFRMPVELLPELGYPSITVQTAYPDAAPSEVEELVTRPIEELVGGVPGIVSVESVSREGVSEIVLDFVWGTAIDRAMADVREKLDRVRLPVESERPLVLRYDPAQEPILRLALIVEDTDTIDFRGLRDIADRRVKQSLEKLSGVAAVQIHGGDEEEVLVELDADRLDALGIDAGEVVTAITADNINRPGGGLTERDNRYLIRTVHEARTAEQLGVIIVRPGAPGQGELRLQDLVVRSGEQPGIRRAPVERVEVSLVDGREAIELAVFREGDANTVRVAEQVLARLGQLDLPEGHRVVVLSNQATFIDAAIQEVMLNTLLGGALAVLVLLFFLRELRSTLVIGVAIPISLLVSFVPLTMLGVSLNLMSLGGLALGVGMLVDNSIVVLEAIARIRERHPEQSLRVSATRGTSEVAASVAASTFTTVAVFFPMAFVEGVAGQLIRDLAYAVSFSILSSLLVSLTLVPVMQAIGSGDELEPGEGPSEAQHRRAPLAWLFVLPALLFVPIRLLVRGLGWLLNVVALPLTGLWTASERAYPKLLRGFLRVRSLVLLAAFGVCAVVLIGARDLGRTLLPEVRQGEIYVQIELPQGTALEQTTVLTRAIARELGSDERLALVFARVGSVTQGGSATGGQAGTHLAQINLRLADELVASPDLAAIEDELFVRATEVGEQILGGIDYRIRLGRPELFSFEAPIEVRVFADESAHAIDHAKRLLPRLRELDDLADVAADDLRGRPEVRVGFDRERLGLAGLDVDRAALAVQRAIQGALAGKLHAPDKQLDIRVQLPEIDRSKVSDVGRITVGMVATTDPVHPRKAVPLTAVASIEPTTGPAEIRRIDGRRGLRIRARAAGEGSSDLATLAARVEEVLEIAGAEIPAGQLVETEIAGQAEAMGDSLGSLAFTAGLALFLVYVVMASSFESLAHPLLIMVTVPLAAVGVVLACMITGTPISAMVGIGGIILGGIVVNNAIVMVDAINQRRGQGLDVLPAVIEAASVRLRPILMTTATTVLGLLPMAFGLGEGAALRQPLALAVIGGLVVATALTLLVIPCAYALAPGRRRRAWSQSE